MEARVQVELLLQAAHEELLDGLHAIATEGGLGERKGEELVVELRQVLARDDGGPPPALGSLTMNTFHAGGLGKRQVVRVCYTQLQLPALQQRHTRLLALVEVDSTLMPHLFIEVASTPTALTAVHLDFISRLAHDKLPRQYSSVDDILKLLASTSSARCKALEGCGGLIETPPRVVGAIPSSRCPLSMMLRSDACGTVLGPTLRGLIGEWLALLSVTSLSLLGGEELGSGLWARERELDLSLFNPRDDPLAARIKRHCGEDVLSMARGALNLGPLGPDHVAPHVVSGIAESSGKGNGNGNGNGNSGGSRAKAGEEGWMATYLFGGGERGKRTEGGKSTGGPEGERGGQSEGDEEGAGRREGAGEGDGGREGAAGRGEEEPARGAVREEEKGGGEGEWGGLEGGGGGEGAGAGWEEALEAHDTAVVAGRRSAGRETVTQVEARYAGLRLGPWTEGAKRSILVEVHNCTALALTLSAQSRNSCRWPMPPPERLMPGEVAVVGLESHGAVVPMAEGGFGYRGPPGHALEAVEFRVSWTTKVGAWMQFESAASPGWRVERDYLRGVQGIHIASALYLCRALPPILAPPPPLHPPPSPSAAGQGEAAAASGGRAGGEAGRRDSGRGSGGGVGVRVVALDCGLDSSPGSRFHSTSERCGHISQWLETAAGGGGGGQAQVEVAALQGVHSSAARKALQRTLADALHLPHLLPLPAAGLLLASRFPVLWHRFCPFPAHAPPTHPALRPPPHTSAGVLLALLDAASLQPSPTAPPRRLLLLSGSVPDLPAVWSALHAALSAAVAPLSAFDPGLASTAALFVGKLERLPPPSPLSAFHPRDILVHPRPPPHAPSLAALLDSAGQGAGRESVGVSSSSRFPYSWDPLHNALAAQENHADGSGHWRPPCRASAILALDWLIQRPADRPAPAATAESWSVKSWWEGLRGSPQARRDGGEGERRGGEAAEAEGGGEGAEGEGDEEEGGERGGRLLSLMGVQCLAHSVEPVGLSPMSQPTDHSALMAKLLVG